MPIFICPAQTNHTHSPQSTRTVSGNLTYPFVESRPRTAAPLHPFPHGSLHPVHDEFHSHTTAEHVYPDHIWCWRRCLPPRKMCRWCSRPRPRCCYSSRQDCGTRPLYSPRCSANSFPCSYAENSYAPSGAGSGPSRRRRGRSRSGWILLASSCTEDLPCTQTGKIFDGTTGIGHRREPVLLIQ